MIPQSPVYLTPADAARLLGVTSAAVRLMVHRGALPTAARTESGVHLFCRADIEALAEQRAQAGRHAANPSKQQKTSGPYGVTRKKDGRTWAHALFSPREEKANMSNVPSGYRGVDLEPLVQPLDYEALSEGREVIYVRTMRILGKDGKMYYYHIIANDAGRQRGLWGSAQLTAKLRQIPEGADIFIRYDGKSAGRRPGKTEHNWIVAVAGMPAAEPDGQDNSQF